MFVPERPVRNQAPTQAAASFASTLRGGRPRSNSQPQACGTQVPRGRGRMTVAEYRRHFATPQTQGCQEVVESLTPLNDAGGEKVDCCVCFTVTSTMTPCGHPLCITCLSRLKQPSCPYCRRYLALPEASGGALARLQRPSRGISVEGLLSQIRTASLSQLKGIAPKTAPFQGTPHWEELKSAVTRRCLESVPSLALRGLQQHADTLIFLKTSGLLVEEVRDNEAVAAATSGRHSSIRTALEDAMITALEASPGSPAGGGSSLQSLRPAAKLFGQLREHDLIRGTCVVAWFTERVLRTLENLRIDTTCFPKHVAVATELTSCGAADRVAVERLVLERWTNFVRGDAKQHRQPFVEELRLKVLDSLAPKPPSESQEIDGDQPSRYVRFR